MKKLVLLFVISLAFTLIVACDHSGNEGDGGDSQVVSPPGVTHYEIVTLHFENYAYRSENIPLPTADFFVQAMDIRLDRVYYAYLTMRAVSLISVSADGGDFEHVGYFNIPGFNIIEFEILSDGNFAFFTTSSVFSPAGNHFTITGHMLSLTSLLMTESVFLAITLSQLSKR